MSSCRDVNCDHYHVNDRYEWVRVCTKRDVCPLEIAMKLPSLAYRLQRIKEALARHGDRDPGLVVYMMRDWPEVSMVGLDDLAWSLASGRWGCHKNDVIGLIERFEEKWSERVS